MWRLQVRETVERGLRQDISSSPDMLKQATRHWGQPAGLQGVFRKLMQGAPPTSLPVSCAQHC